MDRKSPDRPSPVFQDEPVVHETVQTQLRERKAAAQRHRDGTGCRATLHEHSAHVCDLHIPCAETPPTFDSTRLVWPAPAAHTSRLTASRAMAPSASPREVIVGPVDEPPYCTDTRVEAARVPAAPTWGVFAGCAAERTSPLTPPARLRAPASHLPDVCCQLGVYLRSARGFSSPLRPFHSTRTPDSGCAI
ncbi:hypothetical protein B0H10DRAFT_2209275 [Mycena sp. CBHHK59/15]|nr:hypothetical protein B0H10DRAFT_2209275 [Mycena sp. CBHHK59/15]